MPVARPRRASSVVMPDNKRCKTMGCDGKHVWDKIGDRKIYSSFCQEHTCQAPRNEHTPFCINPRNPANRYCAFHGKCSGQQGCTQQARRSEKQWPFICAQHRCQYCPQPRLAGLAVCQNHVTCQIPNCRYKPEPGRSMCGVHLCVAVPNCRHAAMAPNSGHCIQHAPCGLVRGCRNFRIMLPNGQQLVHCEQHTPCAKAAHGCRALASGRSGFCTNHKCGLERCVKEKDRDSHYCKSHTCHKCPQAVFNIANNHAKYCAQHECAAKECVNEALRLGGLCGVHACSHVSARGSCSAPRSGPSAFCKEHRCRHEGCRHEATVSGGFCRTNNHGCVEVGCPEPCLGGADRIRQCLGHWTTMVRENAASEFEHVTEQRIRAEQERARREREDEDERRARREMRARQEQQRRAEREARLQAEIDAEIEAGVQARLVAEAQRQERARVDRERAMAAEEARQRELRRQQAEQQRRIAEAERAAVERDRARRAREQREHLERQARLEREEQQRRDDEAIKLAADVERERIRAVREEKLRRAERLRREEGDWHGQFTRRDDQRGRGYY